VIFDLLEKDHPLTSPQASTTEVPCHPRWDALDQMDFFHLSSSFKNQQRFVSISELPSQDEVLTA
jgi:hypothetical protein